jgi:hypothetical protein
MPELKISKSLMKELEKISKNNDDIEDVIWDLIEDRMELSDSTKKRIVQAQKEIKKGKYKSLEQVKKELEVK